MVVNVVNGSEGTSAGQRSRSSSSVLDKDAFLQLLVAQLKNQNPMNPQNSNEFIGQMAQFSTLEALQNIEKQVTLLAGQGQGNEQLMQNLTEAYGRTNELLEKLLGDETDG